MGLVTALRDDALAIATAWRRLDLDGPVARALRPWRDRPVDLLALGKAAPTMADAVRRAGGVSVRRAMVITTGEAARPGDLVGDHPVVAGRSLAAGAAALDFVASGEVGVPLVLALSGGASALAAAVFDPVDEGDLAALWSAALRTGADIGVLNHVRAAVSRLGGGALSAAARSADVVVLTMVDNVVSGPDWVGSGPATPYVAAPDEIGSLASRVGLDGEVVDRWRVAARARAEWLATRPMPRISRVLVATPDDALAAAVAEARRRGYRVVSKGARVVDEAARAASIWCEELEVAPGEGTVVVGVGEVSVRVTGSGRGGRCQEFVARAAVELATAGWLDAVATGVATDGRDHEVDVGGAIVTASDLERARRQGCDVEGALRANDSRRIVEACGGTLPASATGWNLCDVYVIVGQRRGRDRLAGTLGPREERP